MRAHALLSASGAHRWMVCTKSPRLEEYVEEESSIHAEKGTLAHILAEIKLTRELGWISKQKYLKELKKIRADPLYEDDMEGFTDIHKDFCIERFNGAKDAVIMLEQRLDFSPWVADGFGTSDVTIISNSALEIIDYKNGRIPVSACENSQMMLYALGAVNQFNFLYDFETIYMTICQPRIDNISSFEMTVEDLLKWGEEVVKPKAELAFKGEGAFIAGDHCRFCKAKATCREKAKDNLKLVRMDFEEPPLLTDEEVVDVLLTVDELVKWAKDIQEFALAKAITENKEWAGMKLVEGRGARKYTDEAAITQALVAAGYEQDVIYKKALNTITTLEKQLGKKTFNELLGSFITKTAGKAKLVAEDDKRQAIRTTAEADFK